MPAVTRASTFALAVEKAVDPTTVTEVAHEAFNGDATSGGFAFHYDHGLLICGVTGGRAWSVDPGSDEARRDAVEAFWRVARRQHERRRAAGELRPPEIELVRGDITEQEVDAVVNAANSAMRGGGGVDGAIHRAGGPAILADCVARFPRGLATGDAGWTTAGDLPAARVIHTVGPNHAAGQRDRALLVSCYRRSLEVADELRARTVAFPLLSAGIYGWPLQDAADAAVETLSTTPSGVRVARIVAFGDDAYDAVARALGSVGAV